MKKWNTPEVTELSLTETANGIFDCECETLILFNDHNKKPCPVTPVTPETPEKPADQLS